MQRHEPELLVKTPRFRILQVHGYIDPAHRFFPQLLFELFQQRRAETLSTCMRKHEVADLDDLPLCVEVMERPASDNLLGPRIEGGERQQPATFRERR